MKKLRIVLLTVAVILIAAGAAFATNAAKNSHGTMQNGYYYVESPTPRCIKTDVICTTEQGLECTWSDDNKTTYELSSFISSTMCGDPLYWPTK